MLKSLVAAFLIAWPAAAVAEARLVGDLPRKANKPLVDLPGLETEYGVVRTSEGTRLRTILTRPAGAIERLPAIMLDPMGVVRLGRLRLRPAERAARRSPTSRAWYWSGSSARARRQRGVRLRRARLRHRGPPLSRGVRPDRPPLLGRSRPRSSCSAAASARPPRPLVAQGKKVAGIAVQGGGAVTYLERMINFDRLYLERSGKYSPEQIDGEMKRRIPFHVEYLLNGKTPEQIERERPELKGVWQSVRGGAEAPPHYGRPYAWHQQAAKKDFLAAWTRIAGAGAGHPWRI